MTTQAPASQALEPKAGIYKGRGVAGSQQYGESTNGAPELIIVMSFAELGGKQYSVVLYFSSGAAPYSIERLRALGWEGNDLSDLTGIDKNEVPVEFTWEPWDGKMRLKLNIVSGGGRFNTAKPVDAKSWAAKVNAITGTPAAAPGNSAPVAPTGPKPPF